jgi:hypothetical protein
MEGRQPRADGCHNNVDDYVAEQPLGRTAVRGWYIDGSDGCGAYLFKAHSIVEEAGSVFDITPVGPGIRRPDFLRHLGPPEEFDTMRANRSSMWYPVPLPTVMEYRSAEIYDWPDL